MCGGSLFRGMFHALTVRWKGPGNTQAVFSIPEIDTMHNYELMTKHKDYEKQIPYSHWETYDKKH